MATDKLYTVAGVSKLDGEYKVRFANDVLRIKVLAKHGHEDITLVELPEAMTKGDLVTFLKSSDLYKNAEYAAAIDAADAKYNDVGTVKVKGAKPSMEAIKARATAKDTQAA